jgi:uncharacterized protein
MRFAFDPGKALSNKAKHGFDFIEAQALWNDPQRVEIAARRVAEPRYLVIGQIENTIWTAVVTYREETIRIISVRRARSEERAQYYGAEASGDDFG